MADGTVTLPGQPNPTIDRDGARPSDFLGPALRQRPSDDIPLVMPSSDGGPDIVVDVEGVRVGDDGSVSLNLPAIMGMGSQNDSDDFGENLALIIDDGALASVATEVIEGVEADIQSRSDWIEQYTAGIELLGTKIEKVHQGPGPSRGISKASEPLMLEAMVEYEAAAEAEMLPASGFCKVPTIGSSKDPEIETRASDYQDDMNYFLVEVAKEIYPDTASMLMHQAFCGMGFKKVYRDPIWRRPTSQSILAPDMIVSEEATDLDTAMRVTHQIRMMKGQLARMQLVGQYRNVNLGQPTGSMGIGQQANIAIQRSQGLSVMPQRPQDAPYEVWECDLELDVDNLGIVGKYEKKTPWGMPLPYKVAVEHNSRQVLGIWRNWHPEDELFLKRNMYVKYGLVPSLGFHSWGYLHLLGNQTRNLRSITRLLIDKGMFANFPGGVRVRGARTSTNEIAPRPGEWVEIDAALGPNTDLRKLFMPMPYGPADPTFIQFREMIRGEAEKLAGTVKMEVGEGRTNVPMGTIMSLIEQQIQTMAAVHKRNHRAQKEELHKLRELFAENPEDLAVMCRMRPRDPERPARMWSLQQEFMDLNLVPASDPNVPSSVHRIMTANVMVMMTANPGAMQLFDMNQVYRDAVQALGKDPDRYIIRPDQMAAQQAAPPPDPRVLAKQAELQQKQQQAQLEAQQHAADLQQKQQQGQLDAQGDAAKLQLEREKLAGDTSRAAADNETRRQISQMHEQGEMARLQHDTASRQQDAAAEHQRQLVQQGQEHAHQQVIQGQELAHDQTVQGQQMSHQQAMQGAQQTHQQAMQEANRQAANPPGQSIGEEPPEINIDEHLRNIGDAGNI